MVGYWQDSHHQKKNSGVSSNYISISKSLLNFLFTQKSKKRINLDQLEFHLKVISKISVFNIRTFKLMNSIH